MRLRKNVFDGYPMNFREIFDWRAYSLRRVHPCLPNFLSREERYVFFFVFFGWWQQSCKGRCAWSRTARVCSNTTQVRPTPIPSAISRTEPPFRTVNIFRFWCPKSVPIFATSGQWRPPVDRFHDGFARRKAKIYSPIAPLSRGRKKDGNRSSLSHQEGT